MNTRAEKCPPSCQVFHQADELRGPRLKTSVMQEKLVKAVQNHTGWFFETGVYLLGMSDTSSSSSRHHAFTPSRIENYDYELTQYKNITWHDNIL